MSTIQSQFTKIKYALSTFISSILTSTPKAIVAGSVILAVSHVAYALILSQGPTQAPSNLFAGKPVDDKDYVGGNADSKVVVVEYSDPECPYCIEIHPTLERIKNNYSDKIGFVYRHFPLTQIHSHAFDESKAITCAGNLGGNKKFFEYIDALYSYKLARQTTINPSPLLPVNGKEDIAANLGLDKNAFAACLNSDEAALAVNASINDGVQAGVQGTPASFVLLKTRKGYEIVTMIEGAQSYEYIQAAIEEALSR